MFSAPIRSVHPAGGSAAQRTARVNTRNQGYRQQIIATRQIQQRQQPRVLANPRQDAFQVQERQRRQQQANVRAQHIAIQQVHMVQDQVQNPARANRVLAGQTYQKLREVADIGRLSKVASDTKIPLQHRVGALRSLRSRYGIPVTQESFKGFRQAQAFHSFLHDGKEGDTFALPTNQKGPGLHRVSQTYQLRKVGGSVQPVAVEKRPILSLGGALQGHPYKDQYVRSTTAREGIAAQSGGIARGFTQAGIDTAHYGAKLIPEGKVGTPARKAVTELAALGPNTITGLYGLGAAGVAAAGGNTKPIREMAKSFADDDPIGRLIAHQDLKGFAAHPGIAIAEVLGGTAALDRFAGRVARGGEAPGVRSTRTAPYTRLGRQDRYSKGYVVSKIQRGRDARTDARFNDLRGQAEHAMAAAEAAKDHVIHELKTVQRPARQQQVYDSRATQKAMARRERRAVDRPFIREKEVKDFQKGAKYSGVLYHVTTPESAKVVEKAGLDPAKAQRGTYGLGVYSASRPEVIPGATSTVKVAVRMRNPLILNADKAMTVLKPFRDRAVAKVGKEDLRLLSAEMTRGLQKAGYDGVVVKGAMNGGDYVVNFHPQDIRVISDRNVAQRGGRTSAVIARDLPPEQVAVPVRDVTVKTARRVAGDSEAASAHLHRAEQLAAEAERYNRSRVREAFDTSSPHKIQSRGDLERIADVTEGTNQYAQRAGRAEGLRQLLGKRAVREKNRRPAAVLKGAAGEVQGLIAEGRVAPNRGELSKLANRIESQEKHLADHHQIATNRMLVRSIREVLGTHSNDQLRLLGDDARRYAAVNVAMHEAAKEHDLGTAEEFDMSTAKPFAVEQMGARPNAEGKLVVNRPTADPQVLAVYERDASHPLYRAERDPKGRRWRVAYEGQKQGFDYGYTEKAARQLAEKRNAAISASKKRLASLRQGTVEHVLTLDEIHKAMNAYADRHPGALRPGEHAFISHSSRVSGGGSFNIRADTAKGLSRARRTGAAVVYGTASVGRDAMIGSAIKLRNMVTQVQSFRRGIADAATRDPVRNGGVIAEDTAKAALARHNKLMTDKKTGLPIPGAVEGVAIRLNPFGGRAEQFTRTLHDVDEEGFARGGSHEIGSTIESALKGEDVGSGPWTVIPKPYADRLIEHSRVAGGSSAFLRSMTSAFRHTVLPFSPTWLTGNAVESLGRGAVAGWHPGDTALEQRALAEWAKLDSIAAQRFILAIGTGHLGSAELWKVRATGNAIKSGPLRPLHEWAEKALEAKKVGKPLTAGTDAIRAYTDWIMNTVNGSMESAIKHGMVGTQMRQTLLPRNLGKTTEEAAKAIAGELHSNPAAVQELISSVQRAYGAYEHFTPEMRRFITNYTPFGAWVFNAVTFLTRVLPADHPGLVALLAANDSATRQYRRDNGLDATLAGEKDSGQVPPFLMGSVPTPAWYARLVGADPGAPLRLARYTPLGIATDPTSTLGSMFLPQIPLEVLEGHDFTGRQLRNKDGSTYDDSQIAGYFAKSLALSSIPLLGQAVRAVQKGPLSVVNPVQPVARKNTSSSGSSGGFPSPSFGGSGSRSSGTSGGSSFPSPSFK